MQCVNVHPSIDNAYPLSIHRGTSMENTIFITKFHNHADSRPPCRAHLLNGISSSICMAPRHAWQDISDISFTHAAIRTGCTPRCISAFTTMSRCKWSKAAWISPLNKYTLSCSCHSYALSAQAHNQKS